jgi:hypothetical protein
MFCGPMNWECSPVKLAATRQIDCDVQLAIPTELRGNRD